VGREASVNWLSRVGRAVGKFALGELRRLGRALATAVLLVILLAVLWAWWIYLGGWPFR
jgi:hypothetical protein